MGTLDHVRFVVIDCETTGLRPATDQIIEIAVVMIDGTGAVLSAWSSLVRPTNRPLTGRLAAVESAPTFAEIAGDLCAQLSTGVVAGHNVGFDLRMIDAELARIGVALPTLEYFDTHQAATFLNVDTPNRSLAVLCSEMGVTFDRWHTAAGDAAATADLIVSLLDRAARWGHSDVSRFLRVWNGPSTVWPDIIPTGRVLVRDPVTFPPGGKQPGHPSLFKPSWRRYGDGSPTPLPDDGEFQFVIRASDYVTADTYLSALRQIVLDTDPTEPWPTSWEPEWEEWGEHVRLGGEYADEALMQLLEVLLAREANRERTPDELAVSEFIGGEFAGLDGIATLERLTTTLASATGEDALYFVDACVRLADLYRRHGGRHDDVARTFRRAFDAASAACASSAPTDDYDPVSYRLDDVLRAWWEYTERRRDVEDLINLYNAASAPHLRYGQFSEPGRLAAQSIRSYVYANELPVAERLYTALTPNWPDNCGYELSLAIERWAFVLAGDGRTDEALAICENAWARGWTSEELANRHSLILERLKRYEEALDIAERGLTLPPHHDREALEKRALRCRERLAL